MVGRTKAKEVEALVKELHPDLEKGDKAYPGCYQKTLSRYIESLSGQELEELQLEQQNWQNEGPPMEYRLK
ncbi:MAG: hypothetical protein QOH50_5052 [Kribbellaceae bacterium]|nr:hypothetical protein [Kribbellaceae bacterium]